jgi:hypothetical protein
MKTVVLIFPDTASLFDFLVINKVSNTGISSNKLTASLTDQQILNSETLFNAYLSKVFVGGL